MHKRFRNDECLICFESVIKGIDIWGLISSDGLCYLCRKEMQAKLKISKHRNLMLISFYDYRNISQLIIRYKDYFDLSLAKIFIAPYARIINFVFKGYTIVTVPSSETMINYRGFKHLDLMLKDISLSKIDCLSKSDEVQRFSKNRNVKFSLKTSIKLNKVIIFDDITTSKNSLNAAIDLIVPISNKVVLIVVARN